MAAVVVLDASAMIAFLRGEPGAEIVAEHLLHPNARCLAHSLNLCEVFYDFYRSGGANEASSAIADLVRIGVVEDSTVTGAWQRAGALKAVYRRVSLADCFAIELVRRTGGSLLTADHHEFDALMEQNLCSITFIR